MKHAWKAKFISTSWVFSYLMELNKRDPLKTHQIAMDWLAREANAI